MPEAKDVNLCIYVMDAPDPRELGDGDPIQHIPIASSEDVPMSTVLKDWCTGGYIWLNLDPIEMCGGPAKIHFGMMWCGEAASAQASL